jgi:DNA processing protein
VSLLELADLFILDSVKGFGPQKFKQLYEMGVSPNEAVRSPDRLPVGGKTGLSLRNALMSVTESDRQLAFQRAARQIVVASENAASILTYDNPRYPRNVLRSNNAVPVLYARGDVTALKSIKAVACVGSREIREPYLTMQRSFAQCAARQAFTVVSGFAMGADTVAHRGAVDAGGSTICVMPGGLDRPFPPENKDLFQDLLRSPGVVFLSEFPFGTGASAMNLRKRNKLIVAAALGVLVGQSSYTGGAMNAYRFAVEQRKPVATFEADATKDTTGNVEIAAGQKQVGRSFRIDGAEHEWVQWLSQL